jgi:hypothetical protein
MWTAQKKIACAALAAALSGMAHATDAWSPVSDASLDQMRGGFDAGAGLNITFGIEREGYINGKLVSAIRFNIANVGSLTAEQTNAIATTVIRNGPGNNATQAQPTAALVIQNTLSQQDIRSLTVVNATANSLELIKGLNLQSTLADALARSLGSR